MGFRKCSGRVTRYKFEVKNVEYFFISDIHIRWPEFIFSDANVFTLAVLEPDERFDTGYVIWKFIDEVERNPSPVYIISISRCKPVGRAVYPFGLMMKSFEVSL